MVCDAFHSQRLPAVTPTAHQLCCLGQGELAGRELDPDVTPQPACKEYVQFLSGLSSEPFPVLLAVLWAVERAYHIAWKEAAPLQPPYDVYAQRWSSPQFAQYVDALAAAVDDQLNSAASSTRQGVFSPSFSFFSFFLLLFWFWG